MRRYAEPLLLAFAASIPLVLTASPAAAYLGPIGGLSLLTTAFAMVAAFAVSTIVVVRRQVHAVRNWFRRRDDKSKADGRDGEQEHGEDKR